VRVRKERQGEKVSKEKVKTSFEEKRYDARGILSTRKKEKRGRGELEKARERKGGGLWKGKKKGLYASGE